MTRPDPYSAPFAPYPTQPAPAVAVEETPSPAVEPAAQPATTVAEVLAGGQLAAGRYLKTLPSGFHVILRDPRTFRVRDRDALLRASEVTEDQAKAAQAGDTTAQERAGVSIMDSIAGAAILDWDVQDVDELGAYRGPDHVLPVPKQRPDVRLDMLAYDWAPIEMELLKLRQVLFPDFDVTPDEKSPTPPSAG